MVKVVLSTKTNGEIPDPGNKEYKQYPISYNKLTNKLASDAKVVTTVTDYLEQRGIKSDGVKASY